MGVFVNEERSHQAPLAHGRQQNVAQLSSKKMSVAQITAAQWSPAGRSAIALVRVYGDLSRLSSSAQQLFHSAGQVNWTSLPEKSVHYGHWGQEHAEGVVLTQIEKDVLEISCHGGTAAVENLLTSLQGIGVIVQSWQQQLASRKNYLVAECTEVLTRAVTVKSAQLILAHSLEKLPEFAADINWPADERSRNEAIRSVELSLKWWETGRRLTEGWVVSIVGLPNAGKSSLINRLLGYERSIVIDQPGTTRDIVRASTAIGGWLVHLADTAGVRESEDPLEAEGIQKTMATAGQADLVMYVVDASQSLQAADVQLSRQFRDVVVLLNKCDLPMDRDVLQQWPDALPISTVTSQGIMPLLDILARRLMRRGPAPDVMIPVTMRQQSCLQKILTALKASNIDQYLLAKHELATGDCSN